MLRGSNWAIAQTYLLGTLVQYAQRSQEIRFRLRIARSRLLWAYTLSRSVCCGFASQVANAVAWSRDRAAPVAPFRRGSAGDCTDATWGLSDFAKVPILVLRKTLEI
jgi:hypothetical protein